MVIIMTDRIEEFISLTEQKRRLDQRLNELKPSIISDLETHEAKQVNQGSIVVQLCSRKVWIYSDEVEKAEKVLKKQKMIEQLDEVATFSETKYLTVKGL